METILERLHEHAAQRGDAVAMAEKIEGRWQETTWRQVDEEVAHLGRALIAQGLQPGDCLGILGVNRPRWTLACLSAMGTAVTPAGIYQTCAANQVAYILRHARCRLVFVDDREQWLKVEAEWDNLPDLQLAVLMTEPTADLDVETEPRLCTWQAFLRRAETVKPSQWRQRRKAIEASTPATLIYTSGTTGQPKAVMLSHRNIMETGRLGASLQELCPEDRLVSYLPLAHIAEQMISVHISVFIGYGVYYVPSPTQLSEALKETGPTLFFGVPRVWERIHDALMDGLRQAPKLRRHLARWAIDVGWQRASADLAGRPAGLWNRLTFPLADRLVLSKVRRRLGFDRVRLGASGAAPIQAQILQLFFSLGVPIYEVYGLSETCGPTSWNAVGRTKLGSVGPPLPEVEVEIADDGEVLVRGPNVFLGYLHDEAATREAIDDDGWFHTGDLGALDDEGFLLITGRKKDLLITSGGKNIAPAAIEGQLKQIPGVEEAVVLGDGRRYLTALLSLASQDDDAAALQLRLQKHVDEVNRRLARVESIRDFRVLPRPLSQERGELTPTLKVKRHIVQEHFADLIAEMYPAA